MTLRTLGLIGGMSYHSTTDYYTGINDAVAAAVGGHASAPLLLSSLNFQDVRDRQIAEDWDGAGDLLAHHARALQDAGAQAVMICTNLMHKVAPAVEAAIDVPLLHIGDAVAAVATERGLTSLGVMGAGRTMTDPFYAERLARHGIAAICPSPDDRALTDRIIFDELTQGVLSDASRALLLGVVSRLAHAGADGVALACTELPLLLAQDVTPVPLVDTAQAHIRAAVAFVLGTD